MTEARRDLLESLRVTPGIARALVRGLDPAAAGQAADGEWPVTVLVAHMADVDELMLARLERVLTEPGAVIADYDPEAAVARGGFRSLALADALDRFQRTRARYVTRLTELEPDAWAAPVVHESDGVFTVESFTLRIVHHDLAHLAQIARRLT